ncbi:MAG: hypothetical protein E7070_10540 [Bacteroidales bacterium]|nr:hypothetical protein [Bacteroidales bacterium]
MGKPKALSAAILFCCLGLLSCQPDIDKKALTLHKAEQNKDELQNLLNHYADNDPRKRAAEFLVEHMYDKYYMQSRALDIYDTYFDSLKTFRERDGIIKEKGRIKACWESIKRQADSAGKLQPNIVFDCQHLPSADMIAHIDSVYAEWQHVPSWADTSFNTFLEYVVPYRVGIEKPDACKRTFIDRHGTTRDSAKTVYKFLRRFSGYYRNGRDRFSRIIQKYPYVLSPSQVERGHYGICRDNAMYCIMAMRSIGIPAAKDFVRAWGNKSTDHTWCTLLLNGGGIYPFDPFKYDTVKFDYKPAKIFRSTYSTPDISRWGALKDEVPDYLFRDNAMDVSSQYGKTFDVKVKCTKSSANATQHKYGVICVFSTDGWIPVWYGPCKNGELTFSDMLADVMYIAAFWKDGNIVPCSEPFFLREDGKIDFLSPSKDGKSTLVLRRKYPRFRSTRSHARQLVGAVIEGSDDASFTRPDTLYRQEKRPVDICDTAIVLSKPYRYFRWKDSDEHVGNLAEISFYGRIDNDTNEVKLTGKIFGFPDASSDEPHSYWMAMDGNPDSYFGKDARSLGYVGIDLGARHKAHLSRVRFCPRSDTNFILQGDEYELLYWQDSDWRMAGAQKALADSLIFHNVPSGTLYWLRNLTKGKEERIFTYEGGQQIWW